MYKYQYAKHKQPYQFHSTPGKRLESY